MIDRRATERETQAAGAGGHHRTGIRASSAAPGRASNAARRACGHTGRRSGRSNGPAGSSGHRRPAPRPSRTRRNEGCGSPTSRPACWLGERGRRPDRRAARTRRVRRKPRHCRSRVSTRCRRRPLPQRRALRSAARPSSRRAGAPPSGRRSPDRRRRGGRVRRGYVRRVPGRAGRRRSASRPDPPAPPRQPQPPAARQVATRPAGHAGGFATAGQGTGTDQRMPAPRLAQQPIESGAGHRRQRQQQRLGHAGDEEL
ncbi:MAG: hypothetical protein CAPSK01_002067 [Candidatus Accumulibacter vicinus]|uniref:Uncharacterized protein n=1 Tax=Candidatus Accumulibacter vicinus TaxID=2954382 RepID=A0A084Y0H0_9PROT|nr:MAG: hypothetical protein CAPSK01_002067 [Candidatus Accumulibacter vicinus]